MKEFNYKIGMTAAFVAVILSLLSVYISLKVNRQESNNHVEMIDLIESLKADITLLQVDLKNLELRLADLNRFPSFAGNNRSQLNSRIIPRFPKTMKVEGSVIL